MLLVTSQFTYQEVRVREIDPDLLKEYRPLIAALSKSHSLYNWPKTLAEKQALYPDIHLAYLRGFDRYVSEAVSEDGAYIKAVQSAKEVEDL